ncbi:hypothetical protein MUK42_35510 [Musa troglodytarum]|uniref:Uncharacterized protein n=1 Tax=Musa troglodytarum TaxID=320322 RepID=A0A9E7JB32_9LILI|nr:hypothetical protein MUK42_35510 [Musa troglodytarum]
MTVRYLDFHDPLDRCRETNGNPNPNSFPTPGSANSGSGPGTMKPEKRLNKAKVITFNILDEIFDEQVPLQCSKFGDINYLRFVLFSKAIVTIPMIKNRCSHPFEVRNDDLMLLPISASSASSGPVMLSPN